MLIKGRWKKLLDERMVNVKNIEGMKQLARCEFQETDKVTYLFLDSLPSE
jgi:hypothetical protein